MQRIIIAALLITAIQAQTDFASVPPIPISDDDKDVADCLKSFADVEPKFQFKVTAVENKSDNKKYEVEFPSAIKTGVPQNDNPKFTLYVPGNGKPEASLILVHYLGGSFEMMHTLGQSFASKKLASAVIYLPFYGPRAEKGKDEGMGHSATEEDIVKFYRQSVADIRRIRAVLAHMYEKEVSIMGISLGGIVAALSAGVAPEFYRNMILIGGGDIARVVFNESKETQPYIREFEKRGINEEKLRQICKPIDPLTYAYRIPRLKTLMYNAIADEIIPRICTTKLHDAIGRPFLKWMVGGHYGIAMYTQQILKDCCDFSLGKSFEPDIFVQLGENEKSAAVTCETKTKAAADDGSVKENSAEFTVSLEKGSLVVNGKNLRINRLTLFKSKVTFAGKRYNGQIIFDATENGVNVILQLPLEDYLLGVVPYEIGKTAPLEAKKAQAVAARTYALAMMESHKSWRFDVFSDTRDQVFKAPTDDADTAESVKSTRGCVLFYKDAPVVAYFHACCGGRTEVPNDAFDRKDIVSPLKPVECKWCRESPHYNWTKIVSESELQKGLGLKSGVSQMSISSKTSGGRPKGIKFELENGKNSEFTGVKLRFALGLKSANFAVEKDGKGWKFTGHGWGHGAGLCQWGAIGMGNDGKDFKTIVTTYYPACTFQTMYK